MQNIAILTSKLLSKLLKKAYKTVPSDRLI